jgi:hypothetical protein
MSDIIHHNIDHFNDIKLNSLNGNIRLNTTANNKLYINTDSNTLTINENCAIGFGKETISYGQVGDVLVSNGDQGPMWSNQYANLEADVQQVKEYVQELKLFFDAFKSCVHIEDANGSEFDYNVLLNGPPDVVIQGATALETEVEKLKTYTDDLKLFFSAFQQSIFISDTNGDEFNYSSIL